MFKTYEETPETTTVDYGEYGDVIETIKKFTEFITSLIQKVVDFLKGLVNKEPEA